MYKQHLDGGGRLWWRVSQPLAHFCFYFPPKWLFILLKKLLRHFSFGSDGAASQFMAGWWGLLGVDWTRGWEWEDWGKPGSLDEKKKKKKLPGEQAPTQRLVGKEKRWEWNCTAADSPARRRNWAQKNQETGCSLGWSAARSESNKESTYDVSQRPSKNSHVQVQDFSSRVNWL